MNFSTTLINSLRAAAEPCWIGITPWKKSVQANTFNVNTMFWDTHYPRVTTYQFFEFYNNL